MKVVIFAGGKGSRISEESQLRPKPMIEIGGKPILWHIMKRYAAYGHNEFIICLGYKGELIKEYFLNYYSRNSDLTVDLRDNRVKVRESSCEEFKISLIDTGLETMTAGRLKRVQKYIGDETFMLTYGDGVADIDIKRLIDFHQKKKCLATMTGVQPQSRFGILDIDENDMVQTFQEKPKNENVWINGGFFVLEAGVFEYLHADADAIMWERQPLEDICRDRQLSVYRHHGFWKCMDTLRDKVELNELWEKGPKWKNWKS
ncbi:MAG: glucose-1-phosphate cytidylyltransferase [Candidatus Neomarinimicrobiota bacterium]|jgi:glucose-1-phosphate cytidylyltransferase|nr:glucose-1-phosphate cytidylyltransferase [Candidatus Neomarinimicrobiota bacterium]MDD3965939.1 glucose-1-phosphate cytidylyltransferase [Candidatus Neomarinimicrobiota bacterium]MDX9780463.1 glucose-1-phosphate cytidylyltransferase [bacterium]